MNRRRGLLIGLLALAILGCATVATNEPPANVVGTWQGSARVQGWGSGDIPVVLTLQQTGTQVTGDSTAMSCRGRVDGTVTGDSLRIQVSGCDMKFSVKGDEMTGEYPNQYGTFNSVSLRRSK